MTISWTDFERVDMRVGMVVDAKETVTSPNDPAGDASRTVQAR